MSEINQCENCKHQRFEHVEGHGRCLHNGCDCPKYAEPWTEETPLDLELCLAHVRAGHLLQIETVEKLLVRCIAAETKPG